MAGATASMELNTAGESDVLQAAISTSVDAILNGINLRRAQNGFLPLVVEPALIELAYERAIDMAARGYVAHIPPGESRVAAEASFIEGGFSGQAAELLFSSQAPLADVASITLQNWFDDANHRAVLLSPDFYYSGLGLMGDGTRWVVALLLVESRPSGR